MAELNFGFEDEEGPGGFYYNGGHPNPPVWFEDEIARRGIVPVGEREDEVTPGHEAEADDNIEGNSHVAFYARLTPPLE